MIIKKISRVVLDFLIRTLLGLAIVAYVFGQLFGSPAFIKEALEAGGAYTSLAASVGEEIKNGALAVQNDLPVDDPAVQAIIGQIITPELLQEQANGVLDGTYDWLNGITSAPNISIDFTAAQAKLADDISMYAAERVRNLPPCTSVPPADATAFTIDCLPPGLNVEAERERVQSQIAANSAVLDNLTFTTADLPKNSQGKTIYEQLAWAPSAFAFAKVAPWVLGGLAVALSGLLVVLHTDKRRGWASVGKIYLVSGGFIFAATVVFSLILPAVLPGVSDLTTTTSTQTLATDFYRTAISHIRNLILLSSGVVLGIGIAILVIEKFTRVREEDNTPPLASTGSGQP